MHNFSLDSASSKYKMYYFFFLFILGACTGFSKARTIFSKPVNTDQLDKLNSRVNNPQYYAMICSLPYATTYLPHTHHMLTTYLPHTTTYILNALASYYYHHRIILVERCTNPFPQERKKKGS